MSLLPDPNAASATVSTSCDDPEAANSDPGEVIVGDSDRALSGRKIVPDSPSVDLGSGAGGLVLPGLVGPGFTTGEVPPSGGDPPGRLIGVGSSIVPGGSSGGAGAGSGGLVPPGFIGPGFRTTVVPPPAGDPPGRLIGVGSSIVPGGSSGGAGPGPGGLVPPGFTGPGFTIVGVPPPGVPAPPGSTIVIVPSSEISRGPNGLCTIGKEEISG